MNAPVDPTIVISRSEAEPNVLKEFREELPLRRRRFAALSDLLDGDENGILPAFVRFLESVPKLAAKARAVPNDERFSVFIEFVGRIWASEESSPRTFERGAPAGNLMANSFQETPARWSSWTRDILSFFQDRLSLEEGAPDHDERDELRHFHPGSKRLDQLLKPEALVQFRAFRSLHLSEHYRRVLFLLSTGHLLSPDALEYLDALLPTLMRREIPWAAAQLHVEALIEGATPEAIAETCSFLTQAPHVRKAVPLSFTEQDRASFSHSSEAENESLIPHLELSDEAVGRLLEIHGIPEELRANLVSVLREYYSDDARDDFRVLADRFPLLQRLFANYAFTVVQEYQERSRILRPQRFRSLFGAHGITPAEEMIAGDVLRVFATHHYDVETTFQQCASLDLSWRGRFPKPLRSKLEPILKASLRDAYQRFRDVQHALLEGIELDRFFSPEEREKINEFLLRACAVFSLGAETEGAGNSGHAATAPLQSFIRSLEKAFPLLQEDIPKRNAAGRERKRLLKILISRAMGLSATYDASISTALSRLSQRIEPFDFSPLLEREKALLDMEEGERVKEQRKAEEDMRRSEERIRREREFALAEATRHRLLDALASHLDMDHRDLYRLFEHESEEDEERDYESADGSDDSSDPWGRLAETEELLDWYSDDGSGEQSEEDLERPSPPVLLGREEDAEWLWDRDLEGEAPFGEIGRLFTTLYADLGEALEEEDVLLISSSFRRLEKVSKFFENTEINRLFQEFGIGFRNSCSELEDGERESLNVQDLQDLHHALGAQLRKVIALHFPR